MFTYSFSWLAHFHRVHMFNMANRIFFEEPKAIDVINSNSRHQTGIVFCLGKMFCTVWNTFSIIHFQNGLLGSFLHAQMISRYPVLSAHMRYPMFVNVLVGFWHMMHFLIEIEIVKNNLSSLICLMAHNCSNLISMIINCIIIIPHR